MLDFVDSPLEASPTLWSGWGWDWGRQGGRIRKGRGNCEWYVNEKNNFKNKLIKKMLSNENQLHEPRHIEFKRAIIKFH